MNLQPADIAALLPQGETARPTPFRAVYDATWQRSEAAPLISSSIKAVGGNFIVAAGQKAQINIEWPLPTANQVATRQLNVVVEDGAELTLLEIIKSAANQTGWAADTITLTLGQNAKVSHAVIQHAGGIVTRAETVTLAKTAAYHRLALQTNSPLARLSVTINAAGANSIKTAGINLCGAGQVLDQTTLLTLTGPGTQSNVQQRNAIAAGGQAVFQGKYFVAQQAQQTDGYMLVNNLLLADDARAFGKPELEIYADDVKCSHGASTGGLNPEQLFYMKARGIADADARKLIVAGFAEELLTGWPVDFTAAAQPVAQRWLENLNG